MKILSRTDIIPRCHLVSEKTLRLARYQHTSGNWRMPHVASYLRNPFTAPSAVHLAVCVPIHSHQVGLSVRASTALISASTVLLFVGYNGLFHLSRKMWKFGRKRFSWKVIVLLISFVAVSILRLVKKVMILLISLANYGRYVACIGVIKGYSKKRNHI